MTTVLDAFEYLQRLLLFLLTFFSVAIDNILAYRSNTSHISMVILIFLSVRINPDPILIK